MEEVKIMDIGVETLRADYNELIFQGYIPLFDAEYFGLINAIEKVVQLSS